MPKALTDSDLYEVRVRNEGRGVLDEHGHLILSTSARPFPLHTDGYNLPSPPHYAVLWRRDTSSDSPHSTVAVTRDAFRNDWGLTEQLQRPIFPSAVGPRPALFEDAAWGPGFRWNPIETTQWAQRETGRVDAALREVIEATNAVLRREAVEFTIGVFDALILPNWDSCHGRGPVDPSSTRVLTRLWISR